MVVSAVEELDLFKGLLAGVVTGQIGMHAQEQIESSSSWTDTRQHMSIILYKKKQFKNKLKLQKSLKYNNNNKMISLDEEVSDSWLHCDS